MVQVTSLEFESCLRSQGGSESLKTIVAWAIGQVKHDLFTYVEFENIFFVVRSICHSLSAALCCQNLSNTNFVSLISFTHSQSNRENIRIPTLEHRYSSKDGLRDSQKLMIEIWKWALEQLKFSSRMKRYLVLRLILFFVCF